jgi:multiple sugar transport system ATP-binding protein
MAEVVFDRVTKRFGDVVAVDSLSLDIADQDFLVLLGPSGCGKSTALRMIAGLEEPSAGTIRIGRSVVNGVEPKQRDVAMVFQSYALYPHKSVRQNIEFPLRSRRTPPDERDRLVREAAAQLGLADLLARKPRELSGGQRQRVALARAIVRRPSVFLMDEPLSNLDAKMRTQTRAELVELQQRLGTTFVYVTHDQVEAMTMATRVAVVNDGALQQVDRPQEVYDRPANLFVARFIGSPPMNTVDGEVVDEGGRRVVRAAGGRLVLGDAQAKALDERSARQVVVGLRPEHVVVTPDGAPDGAGGEGLPAKLRLVESLGHERLLVCELEDGSPAVARVGSEDAVPAEGSAVRLAGDVRHLHLFDATTTERIPA